MIYKLSIFAMVVMLGVANVNGAEIKKLPLYNKAGELAGMYHQFSGEVKAGDASKLSEFIIKNKNSINSIFLNSQGGSVREAMIMGEIIRAARLDTWVQPGATCASACFFMWINGATRYAVINNISPNTKTGKIEQARIGLHRPYMSIMENDDASLLNQEKLMQTVDYYLAKKGLPRRLIDLMMSRASNDIYWIVEDDLNELGQSPLDLEELYIAKCNDIRRKLYGDSALAKFNKNTELSDLLNKSIESINDCIDRINAEARQKAIREKFTKILGQK